MSDEKIGCVLCGEILVKEQDSYIHKSTGKHLCSAETNKKYLFKKK